MMKKRKLKRINHSILDRLICVLYENGHCKKTAMARKSNMAYDNCIQYIEFLEKFGIFKRNTDETGYEIISLTEHGINFCKTKLNEIDPHHNRR